MLRLGFLLSIVFAGLSAQAQRADSLVKGVYGNPGALLKAGYSFQELGVNAIFVRSVSLDESLLKTAREQHVKVFVEFPTLNGKGYVDDHPEAWPVDAQGKKATAADWFMGVCPTDPGFRALRVMHLRTILNTYEIDGIWLDYVHWHAQFETPDPILPETCFCARCLQTFETTTGIAVPAGATGTRATWIMANHDAAWRQWRCDILSGWVRDLGSEVRSLQPDALLGIFYCAWYPDDFGGALKSIMGIDLKEWAGLADVLSPMLFHRMMDRPPAWVGDYPAWLRTYIGNGPAIWPIVQAHDKPGPVSAGEFAEVLTRGAHSPSTGVMMFSEQSLLVSPAKMNAVRNFYLR